MFMFYVGQGSVGSGYFGLLCSVGLLSDWTSMFTSGGLGLYYAWHTLYWDQYQMLHQHVYVGWGLGLCPARQHGIGKKYCRDILVSCVWWGLFYCMRLDQHVYIRWTGVGLISNIGPACLSQVGLGHI